MSLSGDVGEEANMVFSPGESPVTEELSWDSLASEWSLTPQGTMRDEGRSASWAGSSGAGGQVVSTKAQVPLKRYLQV